MDAMILAAGRGARLGEITRDTPKALVDVAGKSVLERVARRLIDAGADRLIVNLHHHADLIIDHVRAHGDFGVEVVFSREDGEALETGGGLLNARPLFRGDAPFLLHNVDILTTVDLRALHAAHVSASEPPPVATLAVSNRTTSRYLLVDERGMLGHIDTRRDADGAADHERCGPTGVGHAASSDGFSLRRVAFAGIHVIAPSLFDLMTERGAFSIMDVYIRLAAAGHRIAYHDIGDATWLEVGTPARLEAARRAFAGQP